MNDGQPPLNNNVAWVCNSVDQGEGSSELLKDTKAYIQEMPPEFVLIGAMLN